MSDPRTLLETALETLSGLQQDGKLIGIISHVSALKERISTQINITPESGGRSTPLPVQDAARLLTMNKRESVS